MPGRPLSSQELLLPSPYISVNIALSTTLREIMARNSIFSIFLLKNLSESSVTL